MGGLSVKVRGGRALEVKVYLGSPGVFDVPGRACGHLQSWQKWSFPFRPDSQDSGERAGWHPVAKMRNDQFAIRARPRRVSRRGPGRRTMAG